MTLKATSLTIALAALALVACSKVRVDPAHSDDAEVGRSNAAQYSDTGDFIMPPDWRRWVHVASTATPNGLNNGAAAFPGMHNTYIDPLAYNHWVATGEFRDGTVLVKELVDFLPADYPDESSDQLAGRGYYPHQPTGVGIAVKDTEEFAEEPGGWAYFLVSAEAGVIAETGARQDTASCNACHEAAAAQTDFVFLEYYPNLRNAAPKMNTASWHKPLPLFQLASEARD